MNEREGMVEEQMDKEERRERNIQGVLKDEIEKTSCSTIYMQFTKN